MRLLMRLNNLNEFEVWVSPDCLDEFQASVNQIKFFEIQIVSLTFDSNGLQAM